MTQPALISACWHKRRWHPLQAVISAPLLWGQTVYTTFRWPTKLMLLQEHLARLNRDACWLGLPPHNLTLSIEGLQHYLDHLDVTKQDWRIRLTVYPNTTGLGAWLTKPLPSLAKSENATVLLSAEPLHRYQSMSPETGVAVTTASYQRLAANVKHGILVDCIGLRQYAAAKGFQEVLLVNSSGLVSEGAFSSVAVFDEAGGWAFPHPVTHGCLPGLTVRWFQHWLNSQALPWRWQAVRPDDLALSQGAVIMSAIQGLVPVKRIDASALSWSSLVLTQLRQAQQAWADSHTRAFSI